MNGQYDLFSVNPNSVPPYVGHGSLFTHQGFREPISPCFQWGNIHSIAHTAVALFPEQQEDVLKAEKRFFEDQGKGILFTNGTGTGKTFTGLGIAKRFYVSSKAEILIVVPTDTKAKDWIEEGKKLDLCITQLSNTKDAGQGVVITTYANFSDNEALEMREWDLLIYDESHKLNSNGQGKPTKAEHRHKSLANLPSVLKNKAVDNLSCLIETDKTTLDGEISPQTQAAIDTEKQRLWNKTKVVFLSATPFAYHKTLSYADGCLFDIYEKLQRDVTHYDTYDQFFIKKFGYRIRYGKLTMPESGVDQGLMERHFHSDLVKKGVLSGRKLNLEQDYSREFVLLDSELGQALDKGLGIAYGFEDRENEYHVLPTALHQHHTWMYQNQLLESLKAQRVIHRIQAHLNLGRKVIVFHSYKKGVTRHPFNFSGLHSEHEQTKLHEEIAHFHSTYPQYPNLPLNYLASPIESLSNVFGEQLLVFNGDVTQSHRAQAIKQFNADDSGKDIILVQMEAGKEGISLHDTTGQHQRVIIQLGLPYKPTDAIQVEGRAYRTGNQSDAVFEYPVLLTHFERFAFGHKINQRVRTAENLAMGESARDLETSFKEGYINAQYDAPHDQQGTGGKQQDGGFSHLSPFDKAKTYYYSRAKAKGKRSQRAGVDYFATPEPLGLKMVEWMNSKPNDDLLEPSAGHGAIARFFPGNTNNTFVEPSAELSSELTVHVSGQVLTQDFESLNIMRKYDGIAMNPPFGQGGSRAIKHIAKAFKHLRLGGRIVAIYPQGASADKAFNHWLESDELQDVVISADITLPECTFERAGTHVRTRLLVIDKLSPELLKNKHPYGVHYELQADSVEALFSRLDSINIPFFA